MDGTKQAAQAVKEICQDNVLIMNDINNSPEPLRSMMYHALGDVAEAIDGTELYHEIVDHLEEIY